MFLDGQLRALEVRKQQIAIRGDLGRRLVRLEFGLAKSAALRSATDLRVGWSVAEWLLGFLRKR